jgi:hypothetical protein
VSEMAETFGYWGWTTEIFYSPPLVAYVSAAAR